MKYKDKLLHDALLIDQYKYAPARAVQAVDLLLKLKKKKGKWAVIEEIVNIWVKEEPTEYKSFLITLRDTKETRKITRVGTKEFRGVTYDKKTGGYGKAMLDIPFRVMRMIRAIYKADELPMDKKFFQEFLKRFPKFKIAKKV